MAFVAADPSVKEGSLITWFKVDDSFWGHAKRMRCNNAAIGVWVMAGSWSAQQLTDGNIPRHVLPILGGKPAEAKQLVESGLWETTVDGWVFHDWTDWQPTKAQVQERRDAELARKKAWRDKKAEERARAAGRDARETRDTDVPETDADAERPSTRPDPSRPVPTRPDPKTPTESSGSVTASTEEKRAEKARLAASFAEFWNAYPRRTAKGDAEKAWPKAVKQRPADDITAAAARFAQQQRGVEAQYIPYPATWLNRRQWEDESLTQPQQRYNPDGTAVGEGKPW